jgi:hypothetical protein
MGKAQPAVKREVALRSDAMSVYKPDWREAKARMLDWWAGKKTDRVVAMVTAPRAGMPPCQSRGTPAERHTDFPTIFHNLDQELARTFHGGEAFPTHFVYIGAVPMGAFLGCELEFREDTVWQTRLPYGWDEADRVRFDRANRWWQHLCRLTQASCERAQGRYLVTAGGGSAIGDVMINLFGHEATLLAMAESPDAVRRLRDRMLSWTKQMFDEQFGIVAPYQEGHIDWLRMWAPGTYHSIQCDVSLMLSPRTFNDLFLEELRQECWHLDYSFYHLDGSGALQHLEALLSIKELDGIQWVPEPTVSSDPVEFTPVLTRIREAGKKLYLSCRPERVGAVLNAIGKEGIFLSVHCKDETLASEVLRELERIGM